jgi:hypothetical protein
VNVTDALAEKAYLRIKEYEPSRKGVSCVYTKYTYLQDIYKLLQSEKYYSEGVRNLCFICDSEIQGSLNFSLLKQCIQSSRVFLYQDMLEREGVDLGEDSIFDCSQKAYYSLDDEIVLTKEQKDLFDLFSEKRRLVVSAPTSFGKSRVMREIIAHNGYKQIVVIVPTNALLSETYFTFRMDERLSRYNLVFSTHIEPSDTDSIYIFTPEKFDVYTDENSIDYDFFIFDEVYKVDSSDSRSSVFSSCLYKAYKKKCDYYLIGPYFNRFSESFVDKTNGYFKRYSTDIVQKTTSNYLCGTSVEIDGHQLKRLKGRDARLKQVVKNIDGQNIVYVGRKDSAETRARYIADTVKFGVSNSELDDLVSYIETNISSEWRLIDCLKKGVAFHHAGIPKYIQTEIVDLFNAGVINTIVCTPTLTEGVNTSAKNVIFYDTKKADVDLTGFEVKNIIGRSGRFGQHFIGRAIFLEEHVDQENIDEINYPVFDYNKIPDEDYIQIDENDLGVEGRKNRDRILERARDADIPISLLKKNKYIPFENQVDLISILRLDRSIWRRLKIKSGLPEKHQVDLIIELVHEVLFSESDKKRNWTSANLSRLVKFQIYYNPSIKQLISKHDAVREDTKIRNVLELVYKYFEFSFPKYLNAFENIYNFVYSESLSLALMSTHLQYGSEEKFNILLTDAGVPRSIISHLESDIRGLDSITDIKNKIESKPSILRGLSNLEIKMLSKRI